MNAQSRMREKSHTLRMKKFNSKKSKRDDAAFDDFAAMMSVSPAERQDSETFEERDLTITPPKQAKAASEDEKSPENAGKVENASFGAQDTEMSPFGAQDTEMSSVAADISKLTSKHKPDLGTALSQSILETGSQSSPRRVMINSAAEERELTEYSQEATFASPTLLVEEDTLSPKTLVDAPGSTEMVAEGSAEALKTQRLARFMERFNLSQGDVNTKFEVAPTKPKGCCSPQEESFEFALHRAAAESNLEIVEILLERGATKGLKNSSDETALEFAQNLAKNGTRVDGNILKLLKADDEKEVPAE